MSQGRLAAPPARKVTSLASAWRPEPEPPVGSADNNIIVCFIILAPLGAQGVTDYVCLSFLQMVLFPALNYSLNLHFMLSFKLSF